MTTILGERLQAAMDSAARLPRERQDELDSAAWDAAFAEPGSADFFAELAAEAQSGRDRHGPQ